MATKEPKKSDGGQTEESQGLSSPESTNIHPAGSEPFQFIDEPEDQRNPYVVPSMHQSEALRSHEQLAIPETSQDNEQTQTQDSYSSKL